MALHHHRINSRVDQGATSLANMGGVFIRQEKWELALACYEEAKQIYIQLGDKHKLATTLNNLGVISFNTGEIEMTKRLWQEAIEIYGVLQDEYGARQTQRNLEILQKGLSQ